MGVVRHLSEAYYPILYGIIIIIIFSINLNASKQKHPSGIDEFPWRGRRT